MLAEMPFALHITWTCYGTWLPGDERGHVSNTLLPNGGFLPKRNVAGTPVASGDSHTRARARQAMRGAVVMLTRSEAWHAAQALVEAAQRRGWRIVRAALMPNHVHVVVMDCPNDGPAVRRVFKGCSQAKLCDLIGSNQRWWTAGGSDRYKNDWQAIENAVNYVRDQFGKLVEIVDMVVMDCA
jgi:REP element-mobilizing transposase RayT